MGTFSRGLNRRDVLWLLAYGSALASLGALPARAISSQPLVKAIPATGETLPVIGMGTWKTFDVGRDSRLLGHRMKILQTFFDRGGRMIDSSPMYGSSEAVIGYCLKQLSNTADPFTATKVWTWFSSQGPAQIATSQDLWDVNTFDLIQVHNILSWEDHLKTLRKGKEAGRIRYIGITTSHGRRHTKFEQIMRQEPLDFVQLTYNILDREAEARLLPMAAERGIAVIANRPFRRKALFHLFQNQPLPPWAPEIDCANWAQFFLKFVVSHPAVTCAIPATSQIAHMEENMGALYGRLPTQVERRHMIRYVESL
ncbi:aldo/keto reductase [Marinobacterium jannaschii]|uniref:aldo/keto reductase n=1 Tax=Marinobacterium jannaschii TaxID=64970 RepID=UPI0006860AEF|nr:aldo/keto reductase [Marinobacterium jannaschii]